MSVSLFKKKNCLRCFFGDSELFQVSPFTATALSH